MGGENNNDVLFLGFNSLFNLLCSIPDICTIFVIAAICCGFFFLKSSAIIAQAEVSIKSCQSTAKRAAAVAASVFGRSGPLSCWQAGERKQHIRWDWRDGMDSEVKPSQPAHHGTL